jgi:hypothetical protein
MKKGCFLFYLIFLQFCFVSFGQERYRPGYIITYNSDTIRGLIKLKSNFENSKSCVFKSEKNQLPKVFSPDDIRVYRIENGKYYLSKEVEIDSLKKKVFLEYLVDGIVDLYYYKDPLNEYYFIEKDTILSRLSNEGSIVTVKETGHQGEYEESYFKNSNQYKGVLRYLFQESTQVLKEIPETAFDYRPLIKITENYHKSVCKDFNCIDFTKSTNKSLFLEPYLGIINSWFGLKTSKDIVYEIKPYFGIQLRLLPFKGFSICNLLVGFNYSTNNFEGDFENTLNQYGLPYWIHAKYSIVRVPLTLEYNVPIKKLQPFFSLSYNNIFLSKIDYNVIRISYYTRDPEPTNLRKYEYGASFGLGLRYKLNDEFYIYLKNEFEYRIPSANLGYVLDQTKIYSWMINFGCGFKIK